MTGKSGSSEKTRALVILGLAALTGGVIWISRKPSTSPSIADAAVAVPSSSSSGPEPLVPLAEVDAGTPDATLEGERPLVEDPRCSPIASANLAAFRRAEALAGDACGLEMEKLRETLEECEGNAKGLWALVVEDIEIGHAKIPSGACDGVRFQVALVHVDADGKTTRVVALATPGKPDATVAVEAWGARRIAPLVTSDLDDDGELEALVIAHTFRESVQTTASEIWTFKAGRIQPYAKGAGIAFTRVHEKDGRIDLVTRGPYEAIRATSCQGLTSPIAPEAFSMHGEPLGVFTLNGSTSKAALLAACPSAAPVDVAMGGDSEALATAVVCARAWGKTSAEALKLLETTCTSWVPPNKECERPPNACPEWLKKMAAITPPIQLP